MPPLWNATALEACIIECVLRELSSLGVVELVVVLSVVDDRGMPCVLAAYHPGFAVLSDK